MATEQKHVKKPIRGWIALIAVLILALSVDSCFFGKVRHKKTRIDNEIKIEAAASRLIIYKDRYQEVRNAHENIAPIRATDTYKSINKMTSHKNVGTNATSHRPKRVHNVKKLRDIF